MVDYPAYATTPLPPPPASVHRLPFAFLLFICIYYPGTHEGNKRQGNADDSTLLLAGAYKMLQ